MTLSETTAQWSCGLRYQDIPAAVIAAVRLRLLDIIGCMVAGAQTPEARAAYASSLETFPGHDGAAIGFSGGLSLSGAALVNGTTALVLEYDDSHLESAAHLGSPVIAAALPMAMREQLDGSELIVAVAAGLELGAQLGLVAPGQFTPLGFHSTGIFGHFGAIYALAKCLALDFKTTVDAIGIGGSLSASSMASWEDGSAVKSLHAGLAASAAVNAVSLARHGVSGPSVLFDGRFGFFRAHVQEPETVFHFAEFGTRLASGWEISQISPKAYPCGHYIQPHVEAALVLIRRYAIRPEAVERVTCTLSPHVVEMVATPVEEKRRPNTGFHARMSLQHTLAETILRGTLDHQSFNPENLRDPALVRIADRVFFEVDEAATDRRVLGGKVTITLSDGRTVAHEIRHMRGMPQNPMSETDLLAKFHGNVGGILDASQTDRLIDGLMRLEDVKNVSELLMPACRPLS